MSFSQDTTEELDLDAMWENTVWEEIKEVTIKDEMIASKCGWTPFNNHKVKGFPVGTIVNGNLVMSDGKVIAESKGTTLEF